MSRTQHSDGNMPVMCAAAQQCCQCYPLDNQGNVSVFRMEKEYFSAISSSV